LTSNSVSLDEARRIALAAQGFAGPRPAGRVTARHLAAVIRRIGLVQLDFVNVLAPAHYVVLFSRLGAYDRRLFDRVVYRSRQFTEQWAHEASIIPVETWPLLRHRMAVHRARPWGFDEFAAKHPAYQEHVLGEIRSRGPLSAEDLDPPGGVDRRIPGDAWVGTVPRAMLEMLFGRGLLGVAKRLPNGARVFDLVERLLPAGPLARAVETHCAQRELLLKAARAHGIGTAADLADYYRMPLREARPRIAELVEGGELTQAHVEGWKETAYLHCAACLPKHIEATALLSPFDPVVWYRPRAARLFDFEYRIEIYTPKERRRWGYYVLPFLLNEPLRCKRAKHRSTALPREWI
jgi:uncharacterized protein YcaQ